MSAGLLSGLTNAILGLASIQGISDVTIRQVTTNLKSVAKASWELGTAAEALTELSWPALSVFNADAFPPPHVLTPSLNASDVLSIAIRTVSSKPPGSTTLALVENDGAVGDPASIGIAVLLANWTKTDPNNDAFSWAAGQQLDYLLNHAPRTPQGAISHRSDQVQLWADFVYMAPPFIAYFGALQGDKGGASLLQVAYEQCSLYRDALRDSNGLWKHIVLGSWQDTRHWGTGNAWAAAGMLRVLQTLVHSPQSHSFKTQAADLTSWIQEIIVNSWKYQVDNGTLLNVIDDPTSFADSSSTALLASVTYRMAVITNDTSLIPNANKALQVVNASITADGWLRNLVDPYTFNTPVVPPGNSPEGLAFVLLLHAAWRDFVSWAKESSPS